MSHLLYEPVSPRRTGPVCHSSVPCTTTIPHNMQRNSQGGLGSNSRGWGDLWPPVGPPAVTFPTRPLEALLDLTSPISRLMLQFGSGAADLRRRLLSVGPGLRVLEFCFPFRDQRKRNARHQAYGQKKAKPTHRSEGSFINLTAGIRAPLQEDM